MGGNTEKYITFSVPIKKRLDNGKSITCKIKFIDSFRFMSSSLSILVDYLSEGLHCDKCIDCKSYLDYTSVKDNQLIFMCFECTFYTIIKNNLIKNKEHFNKELTKNLQIYMNFVMKTFINLFCY